MVTDLLEADPLEVVTDLLEASLDKNNVQGLNDAHLACKSLKAPCSTESASDS